MRSEAIKSLILILATCSIFTDSFLSPRPAFTSCHTRLFAELPDIDGMKASEMRNELESYGISTKSLFEKSEFVEALKKARAEGKTPINRGVNGSSEAENKSPESPKGEEAVPDESRQKRYEEALKKANSMKVGDLKKELKNRGISTASFFEKSEFVKAYAEAVADNKTGTGGPRPEEPRDPAFKDVVMQKMARGTLMGQKVIDVIVR